MQQAFIYRRISTDSADSHTLEQQKATCRNYCEANGLTVVKVFQEAESGAGSQPTSEISPSDPKQEQ